MTRYQILNTLLHVILFLMGAGIGSFLNVVIHRLPRGLSVNQPRRSFCPACKYQIPFYHNIPLLSWLLLRGRCAKCGSRIPARYFWVELLVALLVAGTFIDIEHYILPHEITIGGTVAGLLCAAVVPELHGETGHWRGFLIALGSAALGLGLLWAVVEMGKLAFGRKKHEFDPPAGWEVAQPDESEPPVVRFGEEELPWEDIFTRASDRMLVECEQLRVNEREWSGVTAELWMERLKIRQGKELAADLPWEEVKTVSGVTPRMVIPREAMGFGDVLFLMMIGAFAGWKAVLFTVLAASVLGTVVALLQRVTGRAAWSAKIPFGPYLAAGALLWVFYGPQLVAWYFARLVFTSH